MQMKVSKQGQRESAAAANGTSQPIGDSVSFRDELKSADLADSQVANESSTSVESHDHHVNTLGEEPPAGDSNILLKEDEYQTLLSLCQGIVDVTFKPPKRSANQVKPNFKHAEKVSFTVAIG